MVQFAIFPAVVVAGHAIINIIIVVAVVIQIIHMAEEPDMDMGVLLVQITIIMG